MSLQKLNRFLYNTRPFFAATALLFILYSLISLWFHAPFGSPLFQWETDSRLVIQETTDEQVDLLTAGDVVLEIGGQAVVHGRPLYPVPLATQYDFVILRGGEEMTVIVPVYAPMNRTVVSMLLPPTLLTLAGWFVGAIMLLWTRRENVQALYAGYIFLLAAVVLVGVQASLDGVSGAWVAHALIFPLAVCWVYLGTIPRENPLSTKVQRLFMLLFVLAVTLSAAMVYEAVILFPQFTSVEEVTGISLYRMGGMLSSLGLIVCVILLIGHALRLPRHSYRRQQLTILLVFFTIGVFPAVILTIIPSILFDIVLLPFPIAILLMIFIPAGYLFVIYRKGMLGLDSFFSRIIYLALLSLIVFGFYAGGLYWTLRWLNFSGIEAMAPATVIFFPTLLLTIYANKPVNAFVQHLLYGDVNACDDTLTHITVALSAKPEMDTLEQIVAMLIAPLHISRAMLLMRDEKGVPFLAATIGTDGATPDISEPVMEMTYLALRSSIHAKKAGAKLQLDSVQAFAIFDWAEILVPVVARNKQIGLLALSRPREDGYFNAHQVSFLTRVAGVMAVGSDNIILFEAARALSRQALVVREQERKQLAARIHDDPLQQITYAVHELEQAVLHATDDQQHDTDVRITPVAEQLRSAATTLRHICLGLYPPFWDQGVALSVSEIVRQFQIQYDLDVKLSVSGEGHDGASEAVTASTCHILTESLNNVVKHGEGTSAYVALQWTGERVTLSVEDDGPGSDIIHLPYSELLRHHHLGIIGMYEWAKLVNGQLRIERNEPVGVKILFSTPLR